MLGFPSFKGGEALLKLSTKGAFGSADEMFNLSESYLLRCSYFLYFIKLIFCLPLTLIPACHS
jgi:hypothetical protein